MARLSRLPAGTTALVAAAAAVIGLRMFTPTPLYRDSKGPGTAGAFDVFPQQSLISASC